MADYDKLLRSRPVYSQGNTVKLDTASLKPLISLIEQDELELINNQLNEKMKLWYAKIKNIYSDVSVFDKLKDKISQIKKSLLNKTLLIDIMKKYNPISCVITKISQYTKKMLVGSLDIGKNVLSSLWNKTKDILITVKDFIIGPMKKLISFAGDIIKNLSGPVYTALNWIVKKGLSVVTWVVNVGVKILDYIWLGIKTILKLGWIALSKTVEFVFNGVKGFYKWMFNGVLNSLLSFSPITFLFYTGVFVTFTSILLSVASGLLVTGGIVFENVMSVIKTGVKIVGDWIWSGLQTIWDWISKQYNESIVKKWIDQFINSDIVQNFKQWFMGFSVVNKVLTWVNDSWEWIKENYIAIEGWFIKVGDFITDFIAYKGGAKSITAKWIEMARQYITPVIPGSSYIIDFINKMFGGIEATKTAQVQLEALKGSYLEQNLDIHVSKLLQQGKSDEEIKKIVETVLIPELQKQSVTGGVKEEEVKLIVERVMQFKGNRGLASPEQLKKRAELIAQYNMLIDNSMQGLLDNNVTTAYLDQLNMTYVSMNSSQNVKKIDDIQAGTESLLTMNEEFNRILQSSHISKEQYVAATRSLAPVSAQVASTMTLPDELEKLYKDFFGYYNLSPEIKDKIMFQLRGIKSGEFKPNERYYESFFKEIDNSLDSKNKSNSTEIHNKIKFIIDKKLHSFADGGILPIKKNINSILPLNSIGREYIREQIKKVNIDMEKISKKDDNKHITIIEEVTNISNDSYELYTMKQITQGLLGVDN